MVGGTYYGGWPGRWWLPALKPAAPLQGAPFRRDLRDLRESIVRSPAQAWRAVVMAAREMQRSTCLQSAVRPGVHKQARSFDKASHSYFGDILLNKSGLWVALARKVGVSPTLRLLSL